MHRRRLLSISSRATAQFCVLLATAIALGCSVGGVLPDAADEPARTRCVEPRPQMCTRDYRPVCGELENGPTNTFSNACEACSHQTVIGHRPGEC